MDTTRRTLRTATPADTPAIAALIDASIRGLGPERYDPRQIESSLAHLFGVDTAMIDDGTYQPGDRLPTEPELMARHGVSRVTVRQAIALLADLSERARS